MPYFLRTDGVNDVVTTTAINGGSYVAEKFSFKIKVAFPAPSPSNFRQAFVVGTSSVGLGVGLRSDGQFRVNIGNSAFSVGSGVTGQVYEFEFSRPVSQAETGSFQDVIFYVDGVETARVPQPDRVLGEFLTIGFDDRGAYSELDVYEVEWLDLVNPANNHRYFKDSLQGANDTTLPDTIGSNDGTLINFPTDNSQWIFYDDGGGLVDISPASIVSGESFGSATVTPLGVAILPSPLDTKEVFGTTSVASAGVNILPEGISSSEALGGSQVIPLGVSLSPSAIASQGAVQEPTVTVGLALISPDSVESEEVVPEPLLDLMLKQILVPSVPDTFSVGRPIVLGGDRIVIPIVSRTNFTQIKEYLTTLGFSGALEDTILAWLRSEGYEGQWNDAWYAYLGSIGHVGALPERLYRWRRGLLEAP